MTLHEDVYGNLRPLTIGFDEVFNRLDQLKNLNSTQNFPSYNLIKYDDENFSIQLAIAGYSKKDVDITIHDGTLIVSGSKKDDESIKYLHKGISSRNFKRSFALSEDVKVVSATFTDGILVIGLQRVVPEEKKPQKIEIE